MREKCRRGGFPLFAAQLPRLRRRRRLDLGGRGQDSLILTTVPNPEVLKARISERGPCVQLSSPSGVEGNGFATPPVVDRRSGPRVFWRCAQYRRGCRSRCVTVGGAYMRGTQPISSSEAWRMW
ncbi:Protein of unknown function [Gryllus bimaculatus]|nr:Protein of unknown function [Gryllus bimaculatus]